MLVPNLATHQANAEAADQLLLRAGGRREGRPRGSTTSVRSRARRPEMEKIDPELAANPLIFPDDDMLANTVGLHGRSTRDEEQRVRRRLFQQVIGA